MHPNMRILNRSVSRFVFISLHATVTACALAGSVGWAQEFEYPVKHRHAMRDCTGVLRIGPDGIEYQTTDDRDSRKWSIDDIRTFKLESPEKISIVTYEDQKRWAGKDKVFEFTLVDKKATQELSASLLTLIRRPMLLAVIPESREDPAYEIAVKHLRRVSGTRGLLQIYPDKVVYRTAVEGDSRYWRVEDIERFSRPDRFRFQIVSHLPEVYNFELMQDLPEGLYDYLWVRLHPSRYYPASEP